MTAPNFTRQPPVYQGRRLPRPTDAIQDQGLGFDIGTMLTRRRALSFLGLGVATVGLASCGSQATDTAASSTSSPTLVEIPEETAGPYPGDGSNGADVLDRSGVVRRDITSSFGDSTTRAEGVPMTLELTVLDVASGGGPMSGAAVYVWHCDRDGRYSMYSPGVESENYLRGVQVTDGQGVVEFTSIFPACYSGRWPHIHFEVFPEVSSITEAGNALAPSQVALPHGVCATVYATDGYSASVTNLSRLSLSTDNVFGDDAGVHQLATVTGDPNSGYRVRLTVAVDTATPPGR